MALMPAIVCSRCNQTKEQLGEPPVGGELGGTIVARICVDCWEEWRENSARLINHYGLNLGLPEHRTQLRGAMKEFLSIE